MEKNIPSLVRLVYSHGLSMISQPAGFGADGRTRTREVVIYRGAAKIGAMSYDPSTQKVTDNITCPHLQPHREQIGVALRAAESAQQQHLCNIVHAGSQYF